MKVRVYENKDHVRVKDDEHFVCMLVRDQMFCAMGEYKERTKISGFSSMNSWSFEGPDTKVVFNIKPDEYSFHQKYFSVRLYS